MAYDKAHIDQLIVDLLDSHRRCFAVLYSGDDGDSVVAVYHDEDDAEKHAASVNHAAERDDSDATYAVCPTILVGYEAGIEQGYAIVRDNTGEDCSETEGVYCDRELARSCARALTEDGYTGVHVEAVHLHEA